MVILNPFNIIGLTDNHRPATNRLHEVTDPSRRRKSPPTPRYEGWSRITFAISLKRIKNERKKNFEYNLFYFLFVLFFSLSKVWVHSKLDICITLNIIGVATRGSVDVTLRITTIAAFHQILNCLSNYLYWCINNVFKFFILYNL